MLRQLARRIIRFYKTQTIIFVFLGLITFGAVLLNLPIASRDGQSIGFLNAFFTATSASCVTGLIVVDTWTHFTVFGQIVIMLLIQVGGLGFMTMATLFSLVLRRTISLSERLLISESLNYDNMYGIVRLAKHIIIGTLCIEGAGAALLSIRFIPEFGLASGIFKSVFHAVSAFCNAGFDILGSRGKFTNLTTYAGDPLVILTISTLIIVGGIGFYVWEDIYSHRRRKKFHLHTKIAIFMTVLLLTVGTVSFFVLEYSNPETMKGMNDAQKLLAAFFQSVTTRTAGFNSISQDGMTSPSKLVSIMLMFIGGSPGSTAGGIKTVTLGVLIFSAISVARGTENVTVFKRRISHSAIFRSVTIIMIATLVVITGVMILSISESENSTVMTEAFEVVSAFGTVGLSCGFTPSLTSVGKITIITLMYFGRVGVLTIALGLMKSMNSGNLDMIKYPEEKIMVG